MDLTDLGAKEEGEEVETKSIYSALWSRVAVKGSRKILQSMRKETDVKGFSREILEHVCELLGLIQC